MPCCFILSSVQNRGILGTVFLRCVNFWLNSKVFWEVYMKAAGRVQPVTMAMRGLTQELAILEAAWHAVSPDFFSCEKNASPLKTPPPPIVGEKEHVIHEKTQHIN